MTIEMANDRFTERAWLLTYPATTGMGSDFDQMLVGEKDLREIIRLEVEKKRNDARLWNGKSDVDPIMTGSVASMGETFCDSEDFEEVFEDVVRKREAHCCTYSGINDLVPIPRFISVKHEECRMNRRIFLSDHLWGFMRQVVVGKAVFNRYFLDFRHSDFPVRSFSGWWQEFTSYTVKNVLVHNDYTISYIEILENARMDLMWHKQRNMTIHKENLNRIMAIIEKLKNYHPESFDPQPYLYIENKDQADRVREITRNGRNNYAVALCEYSLAPDLQVGMKFTHHDRPCEYYTPDEIFRCGMDVKSLPCNLIWENRTKSISRKKKLLPSKCLDYVFAWQ